MTSNGPGDERWWPRIVAKWHLSGPTEDDDPELAAARAALLAGRLDEAGEGFDRCVARRQRPHDHVGRGDVLLARGRLPEATDAYRRAIELDPNDTLGWLGLLNARIVAGEAAAAAADLEELVAKRPDDNACRFYLANAWYAAALQARSRTGEGQPGVISPAQAELCERAARRILDLRTADPELVPLAERLLAEGLAGRTWVWERGALAAGLGAAAATLGLAGVVYGGLAGNVPVVVAAAVGGALALLGIVLRYRREAAPARG
ncbi:MAG TPA: tetratricopeptide repeat protein [Mycobacteriales bacterium]|nr:tetratricopeptide repeat protein [Mycobacteriales bacterium]